MNKISLIIKHEYISRVKKKSFIIISLLAPIGMLLLMFIPALIEIIGTSSESTIAVIDQTEEQYSSSLSDGDGVIIKMLPDSTPEDSLRKSFIDDGYLAYLVITGCPDSKDNVKLYSESTMPVDIVMKLERDLREGIRQNYIKSFEGYDAGLDSLFNKVNSVKAHVSTITINTKDTDNADEEQENFAFVAMTIAFITMFLIYMFVIMSGSMVMTGVMEEKTSRIVEILISSVKPFELMMGKIIGIALMVLTQFAIWIFFGIILMIAASAFFPTDIAQTAQMTELAANAGQDAATDANNVVANVMQMLSTINATEIICLFIFYFLGGYLLYASLFACIGSAIESQSEGQQLVLVVTIPLIFALYAAIYAVRDPNCAFSVWCSIIPFTSPIVMMARLPFSVPMWQIIVSMVSLIATFIGSTWLASRIYRVGILMYGKKVTFKELYKWFKQSN